MNKKFQKSFQGKSYTKGGQKKNVKCLCKNGQNGDPAWKKSCSWSFQDATWSVSDVKNVQCKARTNLSTTSTTTATPTTTTTTTSTTSTTQANPNTHSKCEIMNTWISCSNCYSYTQKITDWDDYYFNYDTFDVIYDEFTCTFSISF